ncbi:hypothetical protein MMC34_008408, partial [Xylographa carneopallida]|nr:hypothetical protein [Xylographa carneopallida]
VGHAGKFGHEFLEFELLPSGLLRYANSSHYRSDSTIRKQLTLSHTTLRQFRAIIADSGITTYDDAGWTQPDAVGRQELEVRSGGQHVSFVCGKIQSMAELEGRGVAGAALAGMKCLYFVSQDLRCLVMSLITLHFKIKPI